MSKAHPPELKKYISHFILKVENVSLTQLFSLPYCKFFVFKPGPDLKLLIFSWLGPELLVCCLAHRGPTGVFSFAPELVGYSAPRDLHRGTVYSICESFFFHQER